MEFVVKGRNIDLTDDLKQMAEKKIRARVEKYCPKAVEVKVELSQEKNPKIAKNKIAEITVVTPGEILRAKEAGAEMHEAIDKVADKLELQIKKYRGKTIQRGRRNSANNKVTNFEYIEEDLKNQRGTSLEDIEEELKSQIVKVKTFTIKKTTPEDAIIQMELLGHDFFVFISSETGETAIVYRRIDKNYGLIEPVYNE
ncbi:MAG TPA: ribosome-associated translation inhibitor RaiA [Candidatus Humimicrobiaceae bacterium]